MLVAVKSAGTEDDGGRKRRSAIQACRDGEKVEHSSDENGLGRDSDLSRYGPGGEVVAALTGRCRVKSDRYKIILIAMRSKFRVGAT